MQLGGVFPDEGRLFVWQLPCGSIVSWMALFVNYFRVRFAFASEIDYLCVGESLHGLSLFSLYV